MIIILWHKLIKAFIENGEDWTEDITKAKEFYTVENAKMFCDKNEIRWDNIVCLNWLNK